MPGMMAVTEAPLVQVFVRHGCHLCDSLLDELRAYRRQRGVGAGFEIEVLEIEDREDWLVYYREHVPVVVVNGEEVCHYFLDPAELEKVLSCP